MTENPTQKPLHILVLTDRDWMHPQGGGTGTNLYGQVACWIGWGHRVTVIAGSYDGADAVERPDPNLTIHRMGSRLTVFPRAAWAVKRGKIAPDADVVLEVVNGIAFFTPLWLRKPHVTLVHHVHRDHYVQELGHQGRIAAFFLETLPLRLLYRGSPFLTISEAAKADLVEMGLPREKISVAHLGVDESQFTSGEKSVDPRLLYLGRLKQYKRIEHVLDVLEATPNAKLDIAGDGDHREALEAEIDRRSLGKRVALHGHVSEAEKDRLYHAAWLNLTASSAEGWCLTVMESAARGTPSAALRVGGLPESIVDGETGLLADSATELSEVASQVIQEPERLAQLGENARARAKTFTWERTASENLTVLDIASDEGRHGLRNSLRKSETVKAGGLALAALVANGFAAIFTFAFAKILGPSSFGSLAVLLQAFLPLSVIGSALQLIVARETINGRLGTGSELAATVERWMLQLVGLTVLFGIIGYLTRDPFSELINLDNTFAVATILPSGALWFAIAVERGVLQGTKAYSAVGWSLVVESIARLAFAFALVGIGTGVAGVFLGSAFSWLAVAIGIGILLRRRLGKADLDRPRHSLAKLALRNWIPQLGLVLLICMQAMDVIVAKREFSEDAAGAYSLASTAAKMVVWVAIGIGLHLLPEANRQASAGESSRKILARAWLIVLAISIPSLAIFTFLPEQLLGLFGAGYVEAASTLPILGLAMTFFACSYLAVQYMLALGSSRFLYILVFAVPATALGLSASGKNIDEFSITLLIAQAVTSLFVIGMSLRARPMLKLEAAGAHP